ncbi:cathepsin B-like cysteine proteinase 2 [Daktulosphaira vitifoliae]|uniref:cathepsin B-like cysteine proteinase 2 n=1 Tax=Daktulosphaira vitifoliae TaxID=58002 RepID=UPI0021AA3711|nr:cathepsin B-like cysteine proteinase 2 [Daktulosphaira vitifoliae]
MVDIGANGRISDDGVLQNMIFCQNLSQNQLNIPIARELSVSNKKLTYVFVGDEAFQPLPNFMKPYNRAAVTVASVITDRLCIQNGKPATDLSAYHLLSCCDNCCGCKGGHILNAWKYAMNDGLVTGGPYKSTKTCQPYLIAPCHGPKRQFSHCGWRSDIVPDCWSTKCRSGLRNKENVQFGLNYQIMDYELLPRKNHFAIMREIYANGPVQASLHFYDDLRWHSGGIYRHIAGHFEGEHAVKIIGWGQEDEEKYWLLMNSFGSVWGENGTFKIPKDQSDRCMFGYAIIAPKLNETKYFNSNSLKECILHVL